MHSKKDIWIGAAVLIALAPLLPLLTGRFPAIGDMRNVFIPLETFFHSQEIQGHIPAWNPAVAFGFPVIASAQIGFFYPVLFALRLLPIWLELPITLVVHVAMLAIGILLFARKLGMSKHASVLTSLSFSLSQFIWQHLTHLNIFLAIAWFPWQLLMVHVFMSKQKLSARNCALLVLLLGMPFLIGQIQVPFLMMVVALAYGLYIRFSHPLASSPLLTKERLGEVMKLIIIAIGVFLLVAIQLFPTFELARLSSRGSGGAFNVTTANQFSYPLYHLPTLLFPRFYGSDNTYWGKRLEIEYGFYIGVIPVLLAMWFIFSQRRLKIVSKNSPFFYWLGGITFLLALGSVSPFRLLGIEPSLWIFSAPARWLLFSSFSLSIFAGFGFDALWQHVQSAKKFFAIVSGILLSLILLVNIVLLFAPNPVLPKLQSMLMSARASSVSLSSPYTTIVIISLIALPFTVGHKHGKKIILIISALDLAIIAATTTPSISWKSILQQPAIISQLPSTVLSHDARVYSIRDGGDTGAYFTDPSSRADSAMRELQKNLVVPMVSSQFGIYGIEWPASLGLTEQEMQLEKLHPTKPYAIENTDIAKELTIGAVLSPASNNQVTITALDSKPRFEVMDGTVERISETPSQLTLKTNSNKNTTLIVRDTFYPAWHAYVDGNEIPIQKSPLFFRSIQVPAGEHVVLMKYRQTAIRIGALFSFSTLFLIALGLLRK